MSPSTTADRALLLHGWGTSPVRLDPLRDALRADGMAADHWTYEPRDSIRSLGARLAAAADDGEVHLVGHSLGGLVAASAVLDHGLRAASVTTVNTPWRGTWAAWTAAPDDPLGRELRWGSAELRRLRRVLGDHLEAAGGPRWTVLSAALDLAAPPTTAVRVPGGPRLATGIVPVVGHSISLAHDRMIDAVRAPLHQHA